MTMTWFNQRITCGQTTKKAKHGERPQPGKAMLSTVWCTGYAATAATPVDPITWDASMDAELENTRTFNTATTPLIVRQLLKNWASTIPQQWQVKSRSGLGPHAIGLTFKWFAEESKRNTRTSKMQQKGKRPSNKNVKISWKTMNALYSDTTQRWTLPYVLTCGT
jgi:hypothetical protein